MDYAIIYSSQYKMMNRIKWGGIIMSKTIILNGNQSVTVVSSDSFDSYISMNDAEMDKRAKAAVRSA